jgi:hypothetical protein
LNHDGMLTADEWAAMAGDPQGIDANQDGQVSKAEFQAHILDYGRERRPTSFALQSERGDETAAPSVSQPVDVSAEEPGADPTAGNDRDAPSPAAARSTRFTVRPTRGLGNLPGWFLGRDRDGDGQLTLPEFVGDAAGNSREFDRLDLNGDGVVTPRELRTPRADTRPASP